ncbi:hypothetical protein [Kribbella sp. DT2]|uniref:hypothetical protein n=1 Tax=Kribbella sp. DT2 TaxID=3393427 RepID=UPI003CEBF176
MTAAPGRSHSGAASYGVSPIRLFVRTASVPLRCQPRSGDVGPLGFWPLRLAAIRRSTPTATAYSSASIPAVTCRPANSFAAAMETGSADERRTFADLLTRLVPAL